MDGTGNGEILRGGASGVRRLKAQRHEDTGKKASATRVAAETAGSRLKPSEPNHGDDVESVESEERQADSAAHPPPDQSEKKRHGP